MGLLDLAASVLSGSLSQGGSFPLGNALGGGQGVQNVLGAVLGALNNHPGGLGGVVDSLSSGGLGDAVNSWISTGQNISVSPAQIQGALGSGAIGQIAGQRGVSPEMAGTVLSQILPHVVDHLTPSGSLPQGGLAGAGTELLQSILSGALGGPFGTGR